MWRDLRYGLRTLARQPTLAAAIILTLALGIGGSTAIFSVVNRVLLRELPYQEAGQIYMMRGIAVDGTPGMVTRREFIPLYENEEHPLVEAAALGWMSETQVQDPNGAPHLTRRYGVTDRFFDVFRTGWVLGRGFDAETPPGVAALSYSLWRDVLGSDPDIIGKSIQVDGSPRTVVGVYAESFEFPGDPGFIYLMRIGEAYNNSRYNGYVRLNSSATREQFQDYLTQLPRELGPDPLTNRTPIFVAQPFLEFVVGDMRSTVLILFSATALLLLIAAINVTNLLLSRATGRAREMAVREALGAPAWRVVRQLLVESITLTAVGGLLGLGVGIVGVRLLLRIAPTDLPRLDSIPLDGNVILFAMVMTLLIGLFVGAVPAIRLMRSPLRVVMNEGTRGIGGGSSRQRLFGALVVTEVALAGMLVIGAGLLVRSFLVVSQTDPGFNPDGMLTIGMNVSGRSTMEFVTNADGQPEMRGSYRPMEDFYREVQDRVAALPGVSVVSTTQSLPLGNLRFGAPIVFQIPGQAEQGIDDEALTAAPRAVSYNFFDAMEIPILSGRSLAASDREEAPGVAVVSQSFARQFFGEGNPVGQRIRFPENRWTPMGPGFQFAHRTVDELEIVGVAGDVHYADLTVAPEPAIYISSDQWTYRGRTLLVRSQIADPMSLAPAIRAEIADLDPLLQVDVVPYGTVVRASIARELLATTLLVLFGSLALGLAALGVYGLISYSVSQRTREIAVRMAVGSEPGQVVRLFMRRGLALALAGVVAGLAGAATLREVIASQLYGVNALDIGVFAMVAVVLIAVAAAATAVPAWRASRVDPSALLRSE